jgi:integrase
MASIHKDPRGKSPFWYCAYVLPNGQRTFRSTKQSDRKKALKECLKLESAADKARAGELVESQARKILDDILESVGEGPIRKKAIREFFLHWLSGKALAKKPSTHSRYKKAITEFLETLGDRADKSLAALGPSDIEVFRDRRTEQGVSAATVRLDLKLVRSVLSTARRQGLILHNPAEAVDLPLVKSQGRDIFTPPEVCTLLPFASTDWKTAILLGYYVGARLGDVVSLTWASVDLVGGVIFYSQGKTGARVEVPIHPELEEHLLKIAGDNPTGFLCPKLGQVKISGRRGLSKQFGDLMAKAGLDQRQIQLSKSRKFSQLSFHSLRHSFSSALANAGVSADVRMKLMGHKSIDVHQRYTHVEMAPLRQAISTLPSLRSDA